MINLSSNTWKDFCASYIVDARNEPKPEAPIELHFATQHLKRMGQQKQLQIKHTTAQQKVTLSSPW